MSMLFRKVLAGLVFTAIGMNMAFAADEFAAIRASIAAKISQMGITSIDKSPIAGLYQVELSNGQLLYVSSDGEHAVAGDMLRLDKTGPVNLSEEWRSSKRIDSLAALKDVDLVVYPAEGEEKGEVVVFTDTSCGYCRKFHNEIPGLNKMGVTVKYAAWPRYGVASPAGQTMVNVWCSSDRSNAMDHAKTNQPVSAPKGKICDQNLVQDQINVGHQLGIRGTPAVFLMDGRQVGGYVKAEQLIEQLNIK